MSLRESAGALVLRALGATWHVEYRGLDRLEAARHASPRGNVIYAIWHNALLMLAFTHRQRGACVLASQHRDGGWITGILQRLGYHVVRGSSRRGGVEALFQMATLLEQGRDVAATVDGPVGPRYSVHPGVALLARRTGRPIVPVVATDSHGARLSTWDAMRLPAPGARVVVEYLAPHWLEGENDLLAVRTMQDQLALALRRATEAADAAAGRSVEWGDIQDRRGFVERVTESPQPRDILKVAAVLHGAAVRLERRLRPRPPGRAERPWVVGVGNLEAGGTGKTPVLALLAARWADAGISLAILTRGHGGALGNRPEWVTPRTLGQASDETRWLGATLGERVPILVARDKARGLEVLRRQGRVDLVLVDDAFQTARLAVDRHLVLLDWEAPFGNGWLLPAGRLRDRPAALGRAHALLFTRARQNTIPDVPHGVALVPRFLCFDEPAGLRTVRGRAIDGETLRGTGVAVLSGLARPRAFESSAAQMATRHGFEIRRRCRVRDHASIEPELRRLTAKLEALGAARILISAKDAARLPPGHQWDEPLLVLEQRLVIPDLASLLGVLGGQSWSSSP